MDRLTEKVTSDVQKKGVTVDQAVRRDYAEGTIDKEDWLNIRQRTEARITKARQEYDRLNGKATVFADIPAADMVRHAWDGSWNTDRKRAAIKVVLRKVTINPQTTRSYGFVKDQARRRELMTEVIRERTEFDWRFCHHLGTLQRRLWT